MIGSGHMVWSMILCFVFREIMVNVAQPNKMEQKRLEWDREMERMRAEHHTPIVVSMWYIHKIAIEIIIV